MHEAMLGNGFMWDLNAAVFPVIGICKAAGMGYSYFFNDKTKGDLEASYKLGNATFIDYASEIPVTIWNLFEAGHNGVSK